MSNMSYNESAHYIIIVFIIAYLVSTDNMLYQVAN